MSNSTEVHDPSARFAGTSPRLRAGRHDRPLWRAPSKDEDAGLEARGPARL
jgi:hypothetical protein